MACAPPNCEPLRRPRPSCLVPYVSKVDRHAAFFLRRRHLLTARVYSYAHQHICRQLNSLSPIIPCRSHLREQSSRLSFRGHSFLPRHCRDIITSNPLLVLHIQCTHFTVPTQQHCPYLERHFAVQGEILTENLSFSTCIHGPIGCHCDLSCQGIGRQLTQD